VVGGGLWFEDFTSVQHPPSLSLVANYAL